MRQFVLVAGFDYEFQGVKFGTLCDHRFERLVSAAGNSDDIRGTIFDVASGDVVTIDIVFVNGIAKRKRSVETPYSSVTRANYKMVRSPDGPRYEFHDGQPRVMSIMDVYRAIEQIGESSPGTLVELSVLSHAWHGGPILVNSDDHRLVNGRRLAGATLRDPDDKDPRGDLDFIAPQMGELQLKNFRAAFSKIAQIWLWGCSFPADVNALLYKIERHKMYREMGLTGAEVFVFTTLKANERALLYNVLHDRGVVVPTAGNVTLTFEQIKAFACRMIEASYTTHIAQAARVRAYGALVGTYAEFDKGGRWPLMHVAPVFVRHFRFYENYLGFSFDPEGRHYGLYKPTGSCS